MVAEYEGLCGRLTKGGVCTDPNKSFSHKDCSNCDFYSKTRREVYEEISALNYMERGSQLDTME
tara:strand:+ start:3586 stop:3777 length:192 start_codon:yes stop_codon:yes gene_type:complete